MLKPGDVARVKTFKQLGAEFGYTKSGYPACPFGFIHDMASCSGTIVTIKERYNHGAVKVIPPDSDKNNDMWTYYTWHESMFELVDT